MFVQSYVKSKKASNYKRLFMQITGTYR